MKQDLVTDLAGAAIRVRSPRHLNECLFVEFAPDCARISVEACLTPAQARELADLLRAAADHAAEPRNEEAHRRCLRFAAAHHAAQ
jgi:hypothetical protein